MKTTTVDAYPNLTYEERRKLFKEEMSKMKEDIRKAFKWDYIGEFSDNQIKHFHKEIFK